MKVEAIITRNTVYVEVDGKEVVVLYGVVEKEIERTVGVNKLYLSNVGGLIATVYNAKTREIKG